MDLGEAIFRFIAGRNPSAEDPQTMAREARKMAGSTNKLAAALGVSRAAAQQWEKGATPSEASTELLRAALRRAWLSSGRETRMRRAGHINVTGHQDGRDRTILLDQRYLHPGTLDRVVTAYLRGAGPRELQAITWRGIHNAPFYKTLFTPGGPQQHPAHGTTGAKPARPPAQGAQAGPAGGGGPSGGGGGGGPAGGPVGRPDPYGYGDYDDSLAYEGMDLDQEYSMAVASVST